MIASITKKEQIYLWPLLFSIAERDERWIVQGEWILENCGSYQTYTGPSCNLVKVWKQVSGKTINPSNLKVLNDMDKHIGRFDG